MMFYQQYNFHLIRYNQSFVALRSHCIATCYASDCQNHNYAENLQAMQKLRNFHKPSVT